MINQIIIADCIDCKSYYSLCGKLWATQITNWQEVMFDPPRRIDTTVFCQIPESYFQKGRTSDYTAVQFGDQPAPIFLEGPSFDRNGTLWITDIPWGRLFTIDPEGKAELAFEYDGEPNGLKFHKDGRAYIADHKHGILAFDPRTRTLENIVGRARLEGFKGVNDLVFASNGDLYFTDQGQSGLHDASGRVFCLRAGGRLDCLIDNVPSPNGLVLNLAENVLYVAVTRANAIWRLPLQKDGTTSKVGTFIQLTGGTGPDGIAMDTAGNLIVAHTGMGALWVFNPRGEPIYRVDSCKGLGTTNIAYGGPGNTSIFITDSRNGCVLRAEMPAPGVKMFSHM